MQYLREKPRPGTQLDLSHPLNRGLVGCWLMNEGSGIRAFDNSPYKNHGILTNMAVPSCRSSQGLAFDGVDDYVDAGNAASLNIFSKNITLSVWVNRNGNGLESDENIIHKESGAAPTGGYTVYNTRATGLVGFRIRNSVSATATVTSTTALQNNIWMLYTATYDGSNLKIYKNGIFEASTATTINIDITSVNLGIGTAIGAPTWNFNGTIDEVSIYNRALSASEIKSLYMNPYNMFME